VTNGAFWLANKCDILAGLIGDFFNVEVEEFAIENPYSIDAYM